MPKALEAFGRLQGRLERVNGLSAANGQVGDSRTVRLTIPARPEYITLSRLALSCLSRVRPLADATIADLKLALTEACSNSVRHAYVNGDGHVEISFELHRDRLVIEVSDDGGGFEHDESAKDAEAELTEGGLGIAIIRSIADEVEIGGGREGRGSRLRFVKLL
jgi:serine/threonine-protein kinase RsbW